VDLPTDIEMSKVVADLQYVLSDNCGLGDDTDAIIDDNIACSNSAAMKVCLFYVLCVLLRTK